MLYSHTWTLLQILQESQPSLPKSTTHSYTGKTENTAAMAMNVGETITEEGHRACTCEFYTGYELG